MEHKTFGQCWSDGDKSLRLCRVSMGPCLSPDTPLPYPIVFGTVRAPQDLTTNVRHSSRSSALFMVSSSVKPVHSRMLSSHCFFLSDSFSLSPCSVPWNYFLKTAHESHSIETKVSHGSLFSAKMSHIARKIVAESTLPISIDAR